MVKETEIIYALLKAALFGGEAKIPAMDANHWWRLFRLMQKNHVAALCYEVVAKAGAPRDVAMPWLAEYKKATDWHRYQQTVQDDIIETMRKHGIETLVLKGTHTAQHYPNPEVREFGDLDLYFFNRHDEADAVARETLKVNINEDSHHHTKYNYRGVTVESHYDLLNTHYPASNRRYEAILKELISVNHQLLPFNFQFSIFEVLFLLRHMAGHFAAGRITLRDLVDWMMTCNALADKVDWSTTRQVIVDYGMSDFASAICQIASQNLGVTIPLGLPQSKRVSDVEHDMIYGTVDDYSTDGLDRLSWKIKRWRALSWKRRMVYSDSQCSLLLNSLTSHIQKPQSILHKM